MSANRLLFFSLCALTFSCMHAKKVKNAPLPEKVCPLRQDTEHQEEATQSIALEKEGNNTTQQNHAAKQDDDESSKRILQHFAQAITHFFTLIKDPRNPAVVQPQLQGIFSNMLSIFMESFKKNNVSKHEHIMPKQYAMLVTKLYQHITFGVTR